MKGRRGYFLGKNPRITCNSEKISKRSIVEREEDMTKLSGKAWSESFYQQMMRIEKVVREIGHLVRGKSSGP